MKGAPGLDAISLEITYYRNGDGKTPEHKANAETSAAEGFDALAGFRRSKAAAARYNATYGSESEPAEEE